MDTRIAIFSEKGGCGKTTSAVALAVLLDLPLLDLDPQATASAWLSRRTPAHSVAAKRDLAWIADCPPGLNLSLAPTLAAAHAVLIPVRAAFSDLVTLAGTVQFVRASTHAKIAFMCCDIDSRTRDESMLREVLASYELQILGTFTHRASYRRAGMTGKLAGELDAAAERESTEIIVKLKEFLP